MIRLRPNPARLDNLALIRRLDPVQDSWEIHRLTVRDFPGEMKIGHRVAFLHTYAAPSIAELLAATGHLTHDTYRRALDTYLFVFEWIEGGLDSTRGRELLRAMNRMHHAHQITQDDYLYVLGTFSVLPVRIIQRYGWRPITEPELVATHEFYAALGRRMGLRGIPDTYAGMADYLDNYEATKFSETTAGNTLMAALLDLLTQGKSRQQQYLTRWTISELLGDTARRHLGLDRPPAAARLLINSLFRARAALQRRKPAPGRWFVPGSPQSKIYPDGYQTSDLGVDQAYHPSEQKPASESHPHS